MGTFKIEFSLLIGKEYSKPNLLIIGVSQPAKMRVHAVGGAGIIPRPLFEPYLLTQKLPTPLSPVSIFHKGGNPIAYPSISEKVPVNPY